MTSNIVLVIVFLAIVHCCSAAFTVEHVNFIQEDILIIQYEIS